MIVKKKSAVKQGLNMAMKSRQRNMLILAALPIIQIFIFAYLPMFGLVIAFKDYRFDTGIWGSKWVGLDNFKFFLTSKEFTSIAWNTIFLNFLFIIVGMIAAIFVAVLLFELVGRANTKIYQTVMITPNFLSWVIVGYMAYSFLNPEAGFINGMLQKFGLQKVNWYSEPGYWPVILTIVSVWKGVGMNSVYYYANLMGIDSSLFEAAEIDGASKLQKTRYITVPCLKKLAIMLFIMSVGGIFRSDFGLFYQVTRDVGTLYKTTDVMDTYIFRALKTVGDMSMSSAAGFLQSIVGFITVIITNAVVKRLDEDCAMF